MRRIVRNFCLNASFTYLTGGYGSQQLTYDLVATGKEMGVAWTTETATVIRYICIA